jgi:glycogen debranching enzyme
MMVTPSIPLPAGDPIDEKALLGYEVRSLARQSRGPGRLSIKSGDMFLITDEAGNVTPPGTADLGLVWRDGRFLSEYELGVPGRIPTVLSSRVKHNAIAMIDLTFTGVGNESEFETHYVHMRREQLLSAGLVERIVLTNYYLEPIALPLQLRFAADFADLFEMRGMVRTARGRYYRPQHLAGGTVFSYRGADGALRQTCLLFDPPPTQIRDCHATYDVAIRPGERVELMVRTLPLFPEEERPTLVAFSDALRNTQEVFAQWDKSATRFHSDDEFLNAALRQNTTDIRSLMVEAGGRRVISAGIPWYSVPFGRDAIIASLQTLSLQPEVAVDTLRFLAAHQGKTVNSWTEEEPGKIMHELRSGEAARCNEIPHTPYYGTVDATPLFIILLHETYRWLGDQELLTELLPAAEAAMEWIDRYGDADGDGFVEYVKKSSRGLVNQGWKDSFDSVIHPDGTLAEAPIALIEVQGYVYDAKFRLADLYMQVGREAESLQLMQEAQWLRNQIDAVFWMNDLGYYAEALDAKKRQVRTITSNPGHLLWSRVPGRDRARRMRDVLLGDGLFSGWGVRTLAAHQKPYNPVSYHNGTVWPHDNGLIAVGLCYYGMKDSAARLFSALYDAGLHFKDYRLPELFCGMSRRESDFPILYPVACNPQAWASGTNFHFLQGLMGLQPDATQNELRIHDPSLPAWLERLDLHDMRVGNSRVSLRFSRHAGRSSAHLLKVDEGALKVNITFAQSAA